jgi:hypothetical protein
MLSGVAVFAFLAALWHVGLTAFHRIIALYRAAPHHRIIA